MISVRQAASLPPKVRDRISFSPACWTWTGTLRNGYGRFCIRKATTVPAHRHVYEILVAPVPADLVMDHLCRNPRCVNPDHLEPVTNRVNIRRGTGPSAENALKTHCSRGHEYSPDNTWTSPRNPFKRNCRACNRIKQRERKRAAREARLVTVHVDGVGARFLEVGVAR